MPRTNQEWAQLYLDEVGSKYAKDIKIRPKSESKLLKIIKPIVNLFNKNFMEGYITTIGTTIWVPDGWLEKGDHKSRLATISHEVLHVKQAKEQTGIVHGFLYLFPQSLVILSLLSLFAIPFTLSWLWCLLFLLCVAPLPAPFRYMKELEAYRTKIIFFRYAWSSTPEMMQWAKDSIKKNLSKSDYYFCMPFPKMIQRHLDNEKALEKGQYEEIVAFLKRHDLLA